MIDLSPAQKKTVAAGVTVLAFALVAAFVLVVLWAALKFLGFVSAALTPLIVGMFVSMLFKPYYEWILKKLGPDRKGEKRSTSALILMLVSVLLPAGLIIWLGGALVVDQLTHLIKTGPMIVGRLSEWVNVQYPKSQTLLTDFGFKPDDLALMFLADPVKFFNECRSMLGVTGADAMKAGLRAFQYLTSVGSWLMSLIFFVFFLQRPSMTGEDYVREMPFLKDETKCFVAKQINSFFDILVSFFQRQVVICLVEGTMYGLGFMCVGLPYGFVIGFALGVLNLVPLLGSVICMPLALPLAYFGDGGCTLRLVLVLVVWLCGQVLDGYLITPRIQGEKTGLGYAGVIFSFFFWGIVFHSLLGLLLAIPLSAFCVVLWRALKEKYIKGVI